MAFRNKASVIFKYSPDILIIAECEHPQKMTFKNQKLNPTDSLWFGHNQNKGLGIFSYSDFSFKVLDVHNENFKMIVPIIVSNKSFQFNLFAVWANNPNDINGHYVTQVWKAIHYYDSIITGNKTILIGDFNSNTIWDKPKRAGNHSTVVKNWKVKTFIVFIINISTRCKAKKSIQHFICTGIKTNLIILIIVSLHLICFSI